MRLAFTLRLVNIRAVSESNSCIAASGHDQSTAMDFSHYQSRATEPTFNNIDPTYQHPGSYPAHSSPVYQPIDGPASAPGHELYEERLRNHSICVGHTNEDSDMASRSRLTQEQLARLEREFKQRYKPNTEYKKGLAETMGVEYHKINAS